MKTSFLFIFCFIFLISQGQKKRNLIDSINSAEKIEALLQQTDPWYQNFRVNEPLSFNEKNCDCIKDSLKTKSWTKADLDQNGLTDLVVIGRKNGSHKVICVMAKNDGYQIKSLTQSLTDILCSFPVIKKKHNGVYIEYIRKANYGTFYEVTHFLPVNIIFKFGDFIEANDHPIVHNIQRIQYRRGSNWITDSGLTIDIDSSGIAKLNNITVQKIPKGYFTEIKNLLQYINFPNLLDQYKERASDLSEAILTITYDDGKTKTIRDYGLVGTLGLSLFHQKMRQLMSISKETKKTQQQGN